MGTETSPLAIIQVDNEQLHVKLNNPQMGTETLNIANRNDIVFTFGRLN